MGARPQTTKFLKVCMADALLILMKEKQYSKITIKDISDIVFLPITMVKYYNAFILNGI